MCADDHNGTCTGMLARSETEPGRLVMSLVCERCHEVVCVIGSIEHTVAPVLVDCPARVPQRGRSAQAVGA